MSEPTRPVLRWHGGKWKLAPWIISHFPTHQVYVEPFGGAGSVLMRKPRSYAEVYNDLDDDVVALFRVLRSDRSSALVEQLQLTPFSRVDFKEACEVSEDEFEKARRLVIRSFMGFGSNGHNIKRKTGFRCNSNRSGTTPAHDWRNYPDCLTNIIERIAGVVIEHRIATEVMAQHDSADTLHYVDPPYMPSTRSTAMNMPQAYAHEMTEDEHIELLEFLTTVKGMVVLSGYPHELYDDMLGGWQRIERAAHADGAADRTEVLWINPHCSERLKAETAQLSLLTA